MLEPSFLDAKIDMCQPTKQERRELLKIPREIRDKIYKELLCCDRYHQQTVLLSQGVGRGLAPSILRVCTKIQDEAKTMLYNQNCWVLLNVRQDCSHAETLLIPDRRIGGYEHRGRFQNAALEMTLQKAGAEQDGKWDLHLISVYEMPSVCKSLHDWNLSLLDEITLDFGNYQRQSMYNQVLLLDCFREVQGFESVKVTGLLSLLDETNMAEYMKPNFCHFQEIRDRVMVYTDRALAEEKAGQFYNARSTYHDTIGFIDWVENGCRWPWSTVLFDDSILGGPAGSDRKAVLSELVHL